MNGKSIRAGLALGSQCNPTGHNRLLPKINASWFHSTTAAYHGILVIDLYNLAGMPVKGGNSVSGLQMTKVLTKASFKTQNFYSITMKDAENIKSWVSLLTNLFLSRHLIEIAKKCLFHFLHIYAWYT